MRSTRCNLDSYAGEFARALSALHMVEKQATLLFARVPDADVVRYWNGVLGIDRVLRGGDAVRTWLAGDSPHPQPLASVIRPNAAATGTDYRWRYPVFDAVERPQASSVRLELDGDHESRRPPSLQMEHGARLCRATAIENRDAGAAAVLRTDAQPARNSPRICPSRCSDARPAVAPERAAFLLPGSFELRAYDATHVTSPSQIRCRDEMTDDRVSLVPPSRQEDPSCRREPKAQAFSFLNARPFRNFSTPSPINRRMRALLTEARGIRRWPAPPLTPWGTVGRMPRHQRLLALGARSL